MSPEPATAPPSDFFETLGTDRDRTIRDIVLVELLTGANRNEVLRMQWADVDLSACAWQVPMTVFGRARRVALVTEVVELLRERAPKKALHPLVFSAARTTPSIDPTDDGQAPLFEAAAQLHTAARSVDNAFVGWLLWPLMKKAVRDPRWSGRKLSLTAHILRSSGIRGFKTYVLSRATASAYALAKARVSRAGRGISLFIDEPRCDFGRATQRFEQVFAIVGWAHAKHGVESVCVDIDDTPSGKAQYGQRRADVQHAFPHLRDAMHTGFTYVVPSALMTPGSHRVRVIARDRSGGDVRQTFTVVVEQVGLLHGSLRRLMPPSEVRLNNAILTQRGVAPRFGIVVHSAQPFAGDLTPWMRSIRSLERQAFSSWRVCVLEPNPDARAQLTAALAHALSDARLPATLVAARSWDDVETQLDGQQDASHGITHLGLLTAGDELGSDALAESAVAVALAPTAQIVYSDELRINVHSGREEPFYKPDWSPDLLLAQNYIGRFWIGVPDLVFTALRDINAARRLHTGASGARGDAADLWHTNIDALAHDVLLRCSERTSAIHHIPKLLWRNGTDFAPSGDTGHDAQQDVVHAALTRRGIDGTVERGRVANSFRIRRRQASTGLVSIIIPTIATRGLIKTCLATLRTVTANKNVEVICIDNLPAGEQRWKPWLKAHADQVVETTSPFNWSQFNNLAAAHARGEYLLFMNDDIEIIEPDWLDVMLTHAARPEVGVVGARLLYPDGTVQHAGQFLVSNDRSRHAFRGLRADAAGYFGLAQVERNVIGVTGACMLVRRDVFTALGGFNELHPIINNDLDFCLKSRRAGLLNVITPFATLVHHEKASRAALGEDYDASAFDREWSAQVADGDPYFNVNLSRTSDEFMIDAEPIRILHPRNPVALAADIHRILVVKLDHLGDFISSLAALRRLRAVFPSATIDILVSHATAALARGEACIDRVLEFDFFFPVSAHGRVELTEIDMEALRARLAPAQYDLALDLRKVPDTRHVLRYTGARLLAGFDHLGRFPWLDIALEWEADRHRHSKRSHISDDLRYLVEAIRSDFADDGFNDPARHVTAMSHTGDNAPPMICIHPSVGNPMKQWPLHHFAELIDRLVAEYHAQIVLIGTADDRELIAELMEQVHATHAVTSVAGQLGLEALPELLSRCVLFVGNDSGPKHIAASLGVPTVGIHGGLVDAREWGPDGPAAVSLQRKLTCAPCYLARVDLCARHMECLTGLRVTDVFSACRKMLALRPSA